MNDIDQSRNNFPDSGTPNPSTVSDLSPFLCIATV